MYVETRVLDVLVILISRVLLASVARSVLATVGGENETKSRGWRLQNASGAQNPA